MLRSISFLCGLLFSTLLLAAPAARIVSLAPHITELVYAAGMGEQLVAVSSFSDYPPEATQIEQVANWNSINVERILELKPDLVLAWRGGSPQRPLTQLERLGIRVIYLDTQRLADVAENLQSLAQYSAHPEQANTAARQFRTQLQQLKQRYATATKPKRVFYHFSSTPLFTSATPTPQSDILTICGAENIFADSPVPWPQVSREKVLARQPDVIVTPGDANKANAVRVFWNAQLTVPVIPIPENWLSRSGPRLLLAAERLCQRLSELNRSSAIGSL